MIKVLDAGKRSCYVPGRVKPYKLGEAARVTGIAKSTLSDACKRGDVPHTPVGRVVLIPASWVERVILGPQAAASANAA